jgi:hypothetical protein
MPPGDEAVQPQRRRVSPTRHTVAVQMYVTGAQYRSSWKLRQTLPK